MAKKKQVIEPQADDILSAPSPLVDEKQPETKPECTKEDKKEKIFLGFHPITGEKVYK